MNTVRKIGYGMATLGLAAAAQAQTTGPDLTAVTDGVTGLKTAVLAAAATVIGAGLALMAVKFGGRWVVKVFKSFSS